jgi:hypothetical protein
MVKKNKIMFSKCHQNYLKSARPGTLMKSFCDAECGKDRQYRQSALTEHASSLHENHSSVHDQQRLHRFKKMYK